MQTHGGVSHVAISSVILFSAVLVLSYGQTDRHTHRRGWTLYCRNSISSAYRVIINVMSYQCYETYRLICLSTVTWQLVKSPILDASVGPEARSWSLHSLNSHKPDDRLPLLSARVDVFIFLNNTVVQQQTQLERESVKNSNRDEYII